MKSGVVSQGIHFGAFAPSSVASRQVQRHEGFKNATTVAELLISKKLQKQQKNGVIWIDEAGLLGNKDMNQLIDIAKKQNARLFLSGDIKQHNSVNRGDALRTIQEFGGIKPYYLTDIKRQKSNDYRDAVKSISEGDVSKGLSKLEEMDAVHEHPDSKELIEKVASEYVGSIMDRNNTLLVSPTHAMGKRITEAIREEMKSKGLLSSETRTIDTLKNLSYTNAEKTDPKSYNKGMVVEFHQNAKGGIIRGERYEVGSIDKDKITLLGKDETVQETSTEVFI